MLIVEELKFIVDTSQFLISCVDKGFSSSYSWTAFDDDQIKALETNLAEEIIEN